MAYKFTKLSDVALNESPASTANVLIEEDGEMKKAPKSAIGSQADWNETDETNPAYILNKPTSLGGYKYYYYYNYYLYKAASATERPSTVGTTSSAISQEAFESDYYSTPIMLNMSGNIIAPCILYLDSNETSSVACYKANGIVYWGTATE